MLTLANVEHERRCYNEHISMILNVAKLNVIHMSLTHFVWMKHQWKTITSLSDSKFTHIPPLSRLPQLGKASFSIELGANDPLLDDPFIHKGQTG